MSDMLFFILQIIRHAERRQMWRQRHTAYQSFSGDLHGIWMDSRLCHVASCMMPWPSICRRVSLELFGPGAHATVMQVAIVEQITSLALQPYTALPVTFIKMCDGQLCSPHMSKEVCEPDSEQSFLTVLCSAAKLRPCGGRHPFFVQTMEVPSAVKALCSGLELQVWALCSKNPAPSAQTAEGTMRSLTPECTPAILHMFMKWDFSKPGNRNCKPQNGPAAFNNPLGHPCKLPCRGCHAFGS